MQATQRGKDLIFVQIASYRDPELKATVADLLQTCSNPDRLRIGVCWQHTDADTWDDFGAIYKTDPRFRILDVPIHLSKGVCWARNLVQQEYDGETYTLQLDSHHRFVPNWDLILEDMYLGLQQSGFPKPLISVYLPSYEPDNDPASRSYEFWQTSICGFSEEGIVTFKPTRIPDGVPLNKPIPARFYSGHFAFTTGKFCEEVQHDPRYYFLGEEINITVRAFTNGYDLFHPNCVIAWHEYTRKNRTKQWDDDKEWWQKDLMAKKRNKTLFGINGELPAYILPQYRLGSTRSLQHYEQYAGIYFKERMITEQARNQIPPTLYHLFMPRTTWEEQLMPFVPEEK